MAAMESAQRTVVRPPRMKRTPWCGPLSRWQGASPALAAAWPSVSVPSSGRWAWKDGRDDRPDAGDFLHAGGARFHRLLRGDLPVQQREELAALRAQEFFAGRPGAVALGHARLDELRAAAHQRGQMTLTSRSAACSAATSAAS